MDAFNWKFNLWLRRNYWKFTCHSLWKYVLNGLVLLCPPKCLFLKCLLCQNVYSHDVYYGNLQDRADDHARFSNLRSPVCIVLTFLPARDNLKTVWIWIKTVKTVGLIRIQTVCHSDGIPENSVEKNMTMVIMLTLYLLVTVCKLVVTRSGTSKWLCWVWSGSKMVWQSGIPEKFIRVTSIKGYDWSTII